MVSRGGGPKGLQDARRETLDFPQEESRRLKPVLFKSDRVTSGKRRVVYSWLRNYMVEDDEEQVWMIATGRRKHLLF